MTVWIMIWGNYACQILDHSDYWLSRGWATGMHTCTETNITSFYEQGGSDLLMIFIKNNI